MEQLDEMKDNDHVVTSKPATFINAAGLLYYDRHDLWR